jgi:glycosyltransferase involved in cell wall biosynthesis
MRQKIVYIISDIDKALAFEWIALTLDQDKYALSFILLNPGPSALEVFLQIHKIPVQRIRCAAKKDWPLVWVKLLRLLSVEKPDIVHCHLFAASILGLSVASILSVPKRIYTRHHSDFHFRYFPKGVQWDKWCNRLATKIIAPSSAVVKVLTQMEYVPKDKVVLLPHGFDLTYFAQPDEQQKAILNQKYNPQQQYPVIGVIARFTELKGIQYIIPAFQQLLASYPNALLLLFNARGDYEQTLNAQLLQLPASSYRCIPFEQELSAVYALFDVFVQASTDETIEAFGQTYVEALAAGVPSVFTLAGIAADFIVDKENALVVPFKSASELFDGLKIILQDEPLRLRMITKGKTDVQKLFTLPKMIHALDSVYSFNKLT